MGERTCDPPQMRAATGGSYFAEGWKRCLHDHLGLVGENIQQFLGQAVRHHCCGSDDACDHDEICGLHKFLRHLSDAHPRSRRKSCAQLHSREDRQTPRKGVGKAPPKEQPGETGIQELCQSPAKCHSVKAKIRAE